MSETCTAITVGSWDKTQPSRLFTCGQRPGHTGPHNERAPRDWRRLREAGCTHTAWADHDADPCPGALALSG